MWSRWRGKWRTAVGNRWGCWKDHQNISRHVGFDPDSRLRRSVSQFLLHGSSNDGLQMSYIYFCDSLDFIRYIKSLIEASLSRTSSDFTPPDFTRSSLIQVCLRFFSSFLILQFSNVIFFCSVETRLLTNTEHFFASRFNRCWSCAESLAVIQPRSKLVFTLF